LKLAVRSKRMSGRLLVHEDNTPVQTRDKEAWMDIPACAIGGFNIKLFLEFRPEPKGE